MSIPGPRPSILGRLQGSRRLRGSGRELIDLLRETPSFASLDAADLEAVAAAFRVLRVPGGTTVMREGGPADALHVVVRGRLRVTKSAGGGRVELAELGRGEVIGEMALLTEGERTATVTAVRDSLLAALSGTEFARLVERALGEFSAEAAPAADLVLLQAAATRCPEDTKRWLAERRLRGHHHARDGDARDVQRIARLLVNRGVGLALGGGGARGFAH